MIKKQPERICAVCRQSKPKRELIRLVRDAEGNVSLDETGKKSGRGAYLCHDPECLGQAKKRRSLERSLKAKVPDELWPEIESRMAAPEIREA
ncbi:MAG: YlxR family protein [Clostridia bacterium]|nr:YlxR family protein [Clostridia bacterium]